MYHHFKIVTDIEEAFFFPFNITVYVQGFDETSDPIYKAISYTYTSPRVFSEIFSLCQLPAQQGITCPPTDPSKVICIDTLWDTRYSMDTSSSTFLVRITTKNDEYHHYKTASGTYTWGNSLSWINEVGVFDGPSFSGFGNLFMRFKELDS